MDYHILRFDEVASTSAELKKIKAPAGTVAVAKRQTGGYGRSGRQFSSPEDGLYFSVAVAAREIPDKLFVPIHAAVSVHAALSKRIACGIKWPNDIVAQGKKLCGILAEGAEDRVILGVGVNVNTPAEYFATHDLPHAASLMSLTGKRQDAEEIMQDILSELKTAKPDTIEIYRKNCVTLGKDITVLSPGGAYDAVAVDVTKNGELAVMKGDCLIVVNSGEVSIRGSEYI